MMETGKTGLPGLHRGGSQWHRTQGTTSVVARDDGVGMTREREGQLEGNHVDVGFDLVLRLGARDGLRVADSRPENEVAATDCG